MDQNRKIIYADDLRLAIRDDMTIRGTAYAAVVKHINAAPAADASPVVYSRWLDNIGRDTIVCENCGHAWSVIDNCTETFDRCPHCGAIMNLPTITDATAAALEQIGANAHGGG